MTRYIEGSDRRQAFLLPECLDDYVCEDNPIRVIEAFVDELDLGGLGFERAVPAETGRPGYHPAILLKLYVYGYLNRIPSSRRLEREAQRNPNAQKSQNRSEPRSPCLQHEKGDQAARRPAATGDDPSLTAGGRLVTRPLSVTVKRAMARRFHTALVESGPWRQTQCFEDLFLGI